MSDAPEKVTRGRTRGEGTPESLKVVMIRRRASRKELARFDYLWVDQEHTYVVGTTKNEFLAHRWKHYRTFTRDSVSGLKGYEVVFGEASVKNALWLLRDRS